MTNSESQTSATPAASPSLPTKPKLARKNYRKGLGKPLPPPTLEAAQKFVVQMAANKKGNVAMYRFISAQLADLAGLRQAIMRGFGDVILENVKRKLDEVGIK